MAYNKEELKKKFEPILKEIDAFEKEFAGNPPTKTTKKQSGKEIDPLEASTENVLIKPFIGIFGYNDRSVSDPNRAVGQYPINSGKVDLALFREGELSIIVESKAFKYDLDKKHFIQLSEYFNNMHVETKPKFAILTNGLDYKFYSDFENNNNLDEATFFEFNIKNDLNSDSKLEKLYKIMYELNTDVAKEEKIYNRAKKFITENIFNEQSDDFIKKILEFARDKGSQLHEGVINDKQIQKLAPVITRIFKERLKERNSQVHNTNATVIVNAKNPNDTGIKKGRDIANIPANTNLYCKIGGMNATGVYKNGKFVLLAGSIIKTSSGELKTLETDEYFDSPSKASNYAIGRSSNLWTEWKDASGKTLDEIATKR